MREILSDLEVSMDNYLNMSFHCGIQKSLKVLVKKCQVWSKKLYYICTGNETIGAKLLYLIICLKRDDKKIIKYLEKSRKMIKGLENVS